MAVWIIIQSLWRKSFSDYIRRGCTGGQFQLRDLRLHYRLREEAIVNSKKNIHLKEVMAFSGL